MKNKYFFKYPDINPLLTAKPEVFQCPACGVDIEIWTDEVGGKCPSCNAYYRKAKPDNSSDSPQSRLDNESKKLKNLVEGAYKSGASKVTIISTKDIVVEDELADMCREPRCENYGLSKSCPPHVSGPSAFKERLKGYSRSIIFKIDVPSEILYSGEGREIFQLLHELASGIEKSAIKIGFVKAQAYAGGSCKKIFCHDYPECLALSQKGKCRNPEYARPSMSGFGINVGELFKTAGWIMNNDSHDSGSTATKMTSVCGLVLIC